MSGSTRKIIVGVDGSSSSLEAVRWAARQARLTGARLHAVMAWDVPSAYGYVPVVDLDLEREAGNALRRALKEALGADEAERVPAEVARGHAAEVLLDVSRGAELLVVGSRGHGGFSGLLLGSVSQYLVIHAGIPVVVIH